MKLNLWTPVASCLLLIFVLAGLQIGCSQTSTNGDKTAAKQGTNADSAPVEDEAAEKTMMEKANELFEAAKASGATTASNAKEWMNDVYQKSVDAGKTSTNNVSQWVQETYENARDAGTTTAKNAKDWLTEDINRMGAWQYTSRTVSTEKDPDEVVTMLNQMGADKWECFWVDNKPGSTTLYFKKTPKSYVSSIPFRDMIRVLPLLGAGSGE